MCPTPVWKGAGRSGDSGVWQMTRDASSGSNETHYDVWLIEEPPSIAQRSTWEEHLRHLHELAAEYTSPDIDAAIARAEAIVRNPCIYAPKEVWQDHLEGLRRRAGTHPHPDVDQDIDKAEEMLSWLARWEERRPQPAPRGAEPSPDTQKSRARPKSSPER
jgi:hypothetical protein